ncbi:hypothetical protein C0389_01470 [bacterium]|nr:hypothetical protein [bacterium]
MPSNFLLNILIVAFTLLFMTSTFLICILLMRFRDHLEEIRQKKFISKWQNRIFDYISSDEGPQTLISTIPRLQFNNLLTLLRDLLFNLKGTDAERLKGLIAEPVILKYIYSQLRSFKKKKRIKAIYFLRFVNTPEVIELLSKKLETSNELIFGTVVESLASLNAAGKVDRILDLIQKQKHLNADSMLSTINNFDKQICPIITRRLITEKSSIIQQVLIAILWSHKYVEAAKEVSSILIHSTDDKVVLEAIRYLGEIEASGSLETLRMGLYSSKPEIRIASIQAVGKIGLGPVEDSVIERFYDTQAQVKIAAARALIRHSVKGKTLLYELAKQASDNVDVIIAKRVFIERRIFGNV